MLLLNGKRSPGIVCKPQLFTRLAVGNMEPCLDGQPGVRCAGDPCADAICPGHPNQNVTCASFICGVRAVLCCCHETTSFRWADDAVTGHAVKPGCP